MNPSAQPTLNAVYDHPSNPASQTPSEIQAATSNSESQKRLGPISDIRTSGDVVVPSSHGQEGTPSSLGYGVRDGREDRGEELGGPVSNTEGEQMRPAGEGDVYNAQREKHGFGEQEDLAADLDRKKEEQEKIKAARGERGYRDEKPQVDVLGVVGGGGKGFVGAGGEG